MFTPDATLNPEAAQAAWKNLELQTSAYKLAVQQQHLQFLKMDHAAASFNEKNTKLNSWADAKLEAFGEPLSLPSNARAERDDDDDEPVEFTWKVQEDEDSDFEEYDGESKATLEAAYNDGATECKIKIGGKKYKVTNIQGHGDGVRKQVSKKTGEERTVKRSPVGDYDDEEGDSVSALRSTRPSTRPSSIIGQKSGRRSSLAQLAAAGDASLGKAKNVSAGGGMRRSSVMPIKDTTSITKVKMDVAEIESKLGGLRTCVVVPPAALVCALPVCFSLL